MSSLMTSEMYKDTSIVSTSEPSFEEKPSMTSVNADTLIAQGDVNAVEVSSQAVKWKYPTDERHSDEVLWARTYYDRIKNPPPTVTKIQKTKNIIKFGVSTIADISILSVLIPLGIGVNIVAGTIIVIYGGIHEAIYSH
jgi:hypothetical protein